MNRQTRVATIWLTVIVAAVAGAMRLHTYMHDSDWPDGASLEEISRTTGIVFPKSAVLIRGSLPSE